LTNNWAYKP